MDRSSESTLHTALFQFIFPFSIKQGECARLRSQLEAKGYTRFSLDQKELENAYYGDGYCVSHERMERSYLPFAAHVLFPREDDENTFRRFSRIFRESCRMEMPFGTVAFQVLSTDLFICPFQIGFITVRVAMDEESFPLSQALEFADRFRTLENVSPKDEQTRIFTKDHCFHQVEDFIFKYLTDGLEPYLDQSELHGAFFETLPFFVNERMMVQAYYGLVTGDGTNEDISLPLRFRVSQLDGLDALGRPYISATDDEYIEQYCRQHSYQRWGPDTYYMINEQTFCCVSRAEPDISVHLANQMYGEYYYGLLLNLFHKIVLLKLASIHSRLRIDQDYDEIEKLIFSINTFSAKFYFLELISQSQGREIFFQLRKIYGNDALFDEVKGTLNDLFVYQDKYRSKRRDVLLMILTVFTVISGIYGMNQVIDDLEGKINWGKMLAYSPFQYFALLLTFSGIIVSVVLTVRELWNGIRSRRRRFKYQE